MIPLPYRVASRSVETADTVTITLRPDGPPIPTPSAGQFTMLWMFGVGEVPISVAGVDGDALTHTIRRVGEVTEALCSVGVGDPVGVRGPFGRGWDLELATGSDVLVVAGGLGAAPVRPIVTHLLDRRADYKRVALLIGARSPEDLLYRPELERWRSRLDIEVEVTVDTAGPSWRGDVGFVTRLIDRGGVDFSDVVVYACGPEIMLRHLARAVIERGAEPDRVFVSLERNMHCGIGHCGHCQLGPLLLCRTGPVVGWDQADPLLAVRER